MTLTVKSLDAPDETLSLPGGAQVHLVRVGAVTVGKGTAPPGWAWAKHVKPTAGTEWCEISHVGVILSGREAVRMRDGTEVVLQPGDVFSIGPGHHAWVIGDEPCVSLDIL